MIPIILRVVKLPKPILLLKMDQYTKYTVITNIGKQTLDFISQEQRYQTVIEFGRTSTIDNIKYYSIIRVIEGSKENLENQAEWLLTLLFVYNNKIATPVTKKEHEELIGNLLEKYLQIIFVNEKNVTMTDQV